MLRPLLIVVIAAGWWLPAVSWSTDRAVVVKPPNFLFLAVDDPIFMYIAFNAPHDPRQSPERYVARYPVDKIRVPASFLPTFPYQDHIGCGPSLRDEPLAPFPRTEHAVRVHRQEYYALITHLDDQIGKILDALEQSGQRDNTYIFFTADHGLAVGYKLILYPKIARARLYHVDSDPDELRDLIDDPQYNATARRLFGRLVELQTETRDTLALQPTFPNLAR